MAEKKKEVKKTVAKKSDVKVKANTKSKTISKVKTPIKAQTNTQAKAPVQKEEVYPAINIANTFGISSFAFFMMKEAKNFDDGSLMTMEQFQKYYQEVVEGR